MSPLAKNIVVVHGLDRIGFGVAIALKQAGNFRLHFVTTTKGFRGAVKRIFSSDLIDSCSIIKGDYTDDIFKDQLLEIVSRKHAEAIIPIGKAVISISRLKADLAKTCKVLVEDYEKLINFHDKSKTLHMANELDIPHPFTLFPDSHDELEAIAHKIRFPVVLKARKGTASDGVWYAQNPSDLKDIYRRMTDPEKTGDGIVRDSSRPMVQEYIPGELHDVAAFCVNGQMRLGLTQRRLVTKPLSGGIGLVNVTTQNEQLLYYAQKVIEKIRWNGVMLMDFKIDRRDGQPKLLEVNPRFWGTTWLTVKAGYNYPLYLLLNAYGHTIDFPEAYKVGLYCRYPINEFMTIFEKPANFSTKLKRFQQFILRFNIRNCVYYLRP